MVIPSINPNLEELEAARRSRRIMGFDMSSPERELSRLQAVYVAKRAQLEAFECFFEETEPDIVLRGHAGQELTLRLPFEVGNVKAVLRDALESSLFELEGKIITAQLYLQDIAEGRMKGIENDYRPAILSLCMPAATSGPAPAPEALPSTAPPLPAGQRLFVTPPTRSRATSSAQ